jgi:hypothetical protein
MLSHHRYQLSKGIQHSHKLINRLRKSRTLPIVTKLSMQVRIAQTWSGGVKTTVYHISYIVESQSCYCHSNNFFPTKKETVTKRKWLQATEVKDYVYKCRHYVINAE